MDTAHWPPQELGLVKPMGELLGASTMPTTTTTSTVMINNHNDNNMLTRPAAAAAAPQVVERRARPQKEQALSCPRCNSTNTKFCYYNNYSLTQPRYFCKTCRRYWTEGGSLRNVPVGGGSRKNKRSSNSSASISTTSTATAATSSPSTLSNISHSSKKLVASSVVSSHDLTQDQDLNLSFATTTTTNTDNNSNTNCSSAMDLLRGRGLGPFMPMPMPMPDGGRVYPAGFGLHHHEFRAPTASGFSMDGDQISGGGRLLFPFEEARQVSASSATNGHHHHHHHHHHQFDQQQSRGQGMDPSPGFWNGMIGGGGPW